MTKFTLQEHLPRLFFLLLLIILFETANYLRQQHPLPPIVISKQDSAIQWDTKTFQLVHLGNKRFITGLLWIQTLLETDDVTYRKKDLNSWPYLRFNLITDLDPLFLKTYQFGGKYLSVIKSDLHGAEYLLLKGLNKYPNDYNLHFTLGLHYYLELLNPQKAYDHLKKIENHKEAPYYLKSIVAKLGGELYGLEVAYNLIWSIYQKSSIDDPFRKKWEESLYAIKAQIDLECLNGGKKDCYVKDFYGRFYIKRGQIYEAIEPFRSFKVARPEYRPPE